MRWVLASLLIVASQSRSIPSVFQPILPEIRGVFVPTWLPAFHTAPLYPVVQTFRTSTGLHTVIALSTSREVVCEACDVFTETVSLDPITVYPQTHPVRVRQGEWAYVTTIRHTAISFYLGSKSYVIECQAFGTIQGMSGLIPASTQQLVHIAQSMVKVR